MANGVAKNSDSLGKKEDGSNQISSFDEAETKPKARVAACPNHLLREWAKRQRPADSWWDEEW